MNVFVIRKLLEIHVLDTYRYSRPDLYDFVPDRREEENMGQNLIITLRKSPSNCSDHSTYSIR